MGAGKSSIPEKIDPYEILQISPNNSFIQCKIKFRQLIINRNISIKRKVSLAYDVLCNREKYIKNNNIYTVKKKDHFYYTIIGDLENLKQIYKENPNIIEEKDEINRNLLYLSAKNGFYDICKFLLEIGMDPNETQSSESTPLHAAAYYNHSDIVELLIEYGAKVNSTNIYNNSALDEAYFPNIKQILMKNNNDIITNFFFDLKNKNLAKRLIPVKYNNHIIGKKILRSEEIMPKNIKDIKEKWEVAWHGTKYDFLESIMKYGLYPSGSKLENGLEIKPLEGHVELGVEVGDIKDWARAIFVSPSVFYAGHPIYAKPINSNGIEYSVLVETRINPQEYRKFPPTIVQYIQKNGEPSFVEYRIDVKDDSNLIMRIESEKNVVVTSILFAKSDFLKNIKDYYKGTIFVNSEEDKKLFLT